MKILDCTLRDGGYYTNWDFDKSIADTYFRSLNNLPLDYVEIGYRNTAKKNYLGEYYYCPIYVLEYVKDISNKKLVIILDEKDVKEEDVKDLLTPCIGLISMVRMAIDPKNFKRALRVAEKVKSLGFEVGFNVMYMSKWRDEVEFLNQLKSVEGLADYFYMVDSYGGVYPETVKETIDMVKSRADLTLGFHGHNNLEMALANTLTAIDYGVEIVDATITGMGRGAGNLKTELLLTVLNSRIGLDVDFNSLSKVTDKFVELQQEHVWGTNLPYMVSGSNSLPQKDVMEWVSKRYYSFNSIIRALQNKKGGKEDNLKLATFKPESINNEVLLIGGGPSALAQSEPIIKFLEKNPEIAIIHASSKNSAPYIKLKNKQYFCLVGNEGHRLEDVFSNYETVNSLCILPPYPRKMGTYIPEIVHNTTYELENITFTDSVIDSHTVLALQTAINLKARKIYVVGYDGYQGNNIMEKEQELFIENELLFKELLREGIELSSLTPSKYKSLSSQSIYSLLV